MDLNFRLLDSENVSLPIGSNYDRDVGESTASITNGIYNYPKLKI